jgi:cell division septum initiation protein DivIVA
MNVVKFAHEVLDMQDRIIELEREVTRLQRIEDSYNELLTSSIQHSEKMMFNTLNMLLVPGVGESFIEYGNK